ncbi:MAG: hypothetical protein HOP14_07620, partial [Acidobacteria bacterium]|nr:hypothetical protein [Acidobacteriota bacterium]
MHTTRGSDDRVTDLLERLAEGRLTRREFMGRAAALGLAGVAAGALAGLALPASAGAQTP